MAEDIRDIRLIDITVGELIELLDGRYTNKKQQIQQTDTFLKIDDCATITGYSEEYIRQLVFKRKIPFTKLNNGTLRFIKKDIIDWMGNNKSTPTEVAAQRYIETTTISNRGNTFNRLNK